MLRTSIVTAFALVLLGLIPARGFAQPARLPASIPERFEQFDTQDEATIARLIQERIKKEINTSGAKFKPELVKTEANYARLSASSHSDVLYEASFHLQPHYYTHSPTGADTTRHIDLSQPIMYYTGSARTPLALPVVSNLSKALSGDEASYTINIGLLPLPCPNSPDSIHYYVVIERAIESNHTDDVARIEQFAKEFTAKADEPIPIRLASEPLAKGLFIVRLESGQVLDFYDDFLRFIDEHIILNSERLKWTLGKQTISDISSRLSIPYSVARTSEARIELLSVVDTGHPLLVVDTIRQPADYLAEVDMSQFADGPYRYRFVAKELGTGREIYSETHTFQKATPVIMMENKRFTSDTILVGGKKKDWQAEARKLNDLLQVEFVKNDRITQTLSDDEQEKQRLERILDANKKNTIADVHGRVGIGLGSAAGYNLQIGIEASKPSLALDVSFGFLYAAVPYLNYTAPANFSQFTSSPKSLGVQLQWIPVKFQHGLIEPLVSLGYYGIWSSATTGLTSAPLLSAQIGIACEPLGELHGLGLSLAYGGASGLGVGSSMIADWSFKTYVRF